MIPVFLKFCIFQFNDITINVNYKYRYYYTLTFSSQIFMCSEGKQYRKRFTDFAFGKICSDTYITSVGIFIALFLGTIIWKSRSPSVRLDQQNCGIIT